jgi:hypothetical protein
MSSKKNQPSLQDLASRIQLLAAKGRVITPQQVRDLIVAMTAYFRFLLAEQGYSERQVQALITKFRDAGRRSAPWKPTSSRVPGRPQDGTDGNRISRWLLPAGHKFYANEVDATLVEVKYYLQTLSMLEAPSPHPHLFQDDFGWLLGHSIQPNTYFDPIQLIEIHFQAFIQDPKLVQSGHLIPLDRGGKHVPDNAFLMLARSNQLQGNLTLVELLQLMENIIHRHQLRPKPD